MGLLVQACGMEMVKMDSRTEVHLTSIQMATAKEPENHKCCLRIWKIGTLGNDGGMLNGTAAVESSTAISKES